MSKSNLFHNDGKEAITQNNGLEAPNAGDQKRSDEYHTFRNLSQEFRDGDLTPSKNNDTNSEFASKNGEKILAVYNAPDGSDKKYARNPNERDDFYDNVKNFKIMHNTSQNSSNLASSIYPNQKTDSPLVESEGHLKSSHPELNSILKESTKQIDKIMKMLEEHKKKKALRHLNDSIDRIDTSGASVTEEYIREMKAKLSNNTSLGPPPLENIEDYSAKKPAPNIQAAAGMNGSIYPSSSKNYSLSQTNTPKSKRIPGTDIKNPMQDQSPKISKASARIPTELETEPNVAKGSESARHNRGTTYSNSNKPKSIDQNGMGSPKVPVEDRLIMSKQQRENRLKQLSQERNQEEMKELKNIPTISKKSKEIVQNSERLQRQREELDSYIRKEKTQITIIEEQEELLKTEISNMKSDTRTNEPKSPGKDDEVVITEGNQPTKENELEIKDTAEEETKKRTGVQSSIYSRLRKKEERTYSEIFLQKRSRSPTQDNSKFTTPHDRSRQSEDKTVHSPKTTEILKKVSTPKHILLKFELPQSEPKLKKTSMSSPSLKQDSLPTKSLSKQIEQIVGNKNSLKTEPSPEPQETQDGFDMVQKLQIMSKNLKQIKNQRLVIRANSIKKKQEELASRESPEKSIKTLGNERLSNQSLMESVKLRKNKFFEIIDNSLTIKDKEEVLRDLGENQLTQADGYEIDGALKKWDEIPIYERQALWLTARKNKVDSIGSQQIKRELEECTFQPVLISKFASPKNFTPGATPNKSLINGGDSRLTNRSKSRSFSRERKNAQGSYHKWHELRKTWENEWRPYEDVANGTLRK